MPQLDDFSIINRTKVLINGKEVAGSLIEHTEPNKKNNTAAVPDGKGGDINVPTGVSVDGPYVMKFHNGTALKELNDWFDEVVTKGVASKKTITIIHSDFAGAKVSTTTLIGVLPISKKGKTIKLGEKEALVEQEYEFSVDEIKYS